MAVKHTVCDPRRERLHSAAQIGGRHDGRAESNFFAALTANPSHGESLAPVPETAPLLSPGRSVAASAKSELAVRGGEPWKSRSVADLASRLSDSSRSRDAGTGAVVEALVLQGARGVALRAIGEAEDHTVASRVVVDLEKRRLQQQRHRQQQQQRRPIGREIACAVPPGRADSGVMAERPQFGEVVPSSGSRQPVSFGAVYEYRDSCGTPKVVASTATMPERQYLLDKRQHGPNLPSEGVEPKLVWVGLSGAGAGGLSDAQMAEVRRSVANSRADRLHAQKLSDIKPYSRHG